jgi:hypothetical protein
MGRLRLDEAAGLTDWVLWGASLGLAFGIWDLFYTWREPLADDTPLALLTFYGPMFAAWGFAGFRARKRSGQLSEAVKAGLTVACVTFTIFYVANFVRVNVFLETLRLRADWQNMVSRFETSGWGSLRAFINYDYLKGAPFKIGVAGAIGAGTGLLGGLLAHITRQRIDSPPTARIGSSADSA